MSHPSRRQRMLTLPVILSLLCGAGCRDNPAALAAPPGGGVEFVTTVVCSVDVKARSTVCREMESGDVPSGAGGASLTLIRDAQMMVETGEDAYTPADSAYRLDIRLVNTAETALGTRDGSTVTGIQAFLPVNPMGYAGRPRGDTTKPAAYLIPPLANQNTLARARNPDGRMAFTGANQPYWTYAQKLEPGETSDWREWQFTLDPAVSYFYFAVSVFAAVPGEGAVPAQLPAGLNLPARYDSTEFLRPCDISGLTRCVYDAVSIRFRATSSQQERQAAVEVVEGTVEGWSHATAEYFIRIPAEPDFVALKQALAALRRLPQVEMAVPYGPFDLEPSYLRPNDGTNWNQWQVRDSSADGRNWALEAISAPLAWGCDTGTVNGVAIVDTDFHLVTDLAPNLTAANALVGQLTAAADSVDHGTQVSAIVAAVGNNAAGITGMMWHPSVRVYETARDSAGAIVRQSNGRAQISDLVALTQIEQAVNDGATVVNVSLGFPWSRWAASKGWIAAGGHYDPGTETNAARIAARDTVLLILGSRMTNTLTALRTAGRNPLLVLSAGNDAISVTWNPFTRVPADVRDNLMIVGSVRDAGSGQLAFSTTFSNYGDTLDLVAPGEGVWTLNRNGQLGSSGTSLSSPYVTGTAGLLMAFDPRLANRGDSLKALILQGASQGQRRVRNGAGPDSIAVLNAYEALKAAARRPTAPLCGNRLWFEGGSLRAQRNGQNESLAPQPSSTTTSAVVPLHGGRKLRMRTSTQVLTYGYANGAWTLQTPAEALYAGAVSGTAQSAISRSHAGDSVAEVRNGAGGRLLVGVRVVSSGAFITLNSDLVRSGTFTADTVCIAESSTSCLAWEPTYTQQTGYQTSVTYSPMGDEILFSVTLGSTIREVLPWYFCSERIPSDATLIGFQMQPEYRCRDVKYTSSSAPSEVFAVRVPGGQLRTLPAMGTSVISFLGVSEDGREAGVHDILSSGVRTMKWEVQTMNNPDGTTRKVAAFNPESTGSMACTVRYRNVRTGAESSTAPCTNPNDPKFAPFSATRGVSP